MQRRHVRFCLPSSTMIWIGVDLCDSCGVWMWRILETRTCVQSLDYGCLAKYGYGQSILVFLHSSTFEWAERKRRCRLARKRAIGSLKCWTAHVLIALSPLLYPKHFHRCSPSSVHRFVRRRYQSIIFLTLHSKSDHPQPITGITFITRLPISSSTLSAITATQHNNTPERALVGAHQMYEASSQGLVRERREGCTMQKAQAQINAGRYLHGAMASNRRTFESE